jgi:hypothetical protein
MEVLITQFLNPLFILLEYSSEHSVLKRPQPTFFPSDERQILTFTENNNYNVDCSFKEVTIFFLRILRIQ